MYLAFLTIVWQIDVWPMDTALKTRKGKNRRYFNYLGWVNSLGIIQATLPQEGTNTMID
jgi:hypothetical protein